VTLQSNGFSTSTAGAITAVYGLAVLVFARVVRRLSFRLPPARLIGLGGGCGAFAYSALVVDQQAVGVLVGSTLIGAAWAFMHSTLQTWVTEVVPEARATAVCLFATMLFTGSAVASGLGSGLVLDGRFRLLFVLGLVLMLVLGLAATTSRHQYAKRH
ncbi:MAG: MFS transporter, partial [Propionibacteriales bacterium]|nr:MFS transporter [Propionibacteriales bacterium]